jgi:hypothetical protein
MAMPKIPPLTTTTKREFIDVDGTPLTSLGVREKAGPDAAGGVQKEKTLVSIVTVDGVVYHSGMDLELVVCACCRRGLEASWFHKAERPTHGLCTEVAVRCSRPGCGAWACPRHAVRDGDDDQRWVCRDCAARWNWKALLRAVFFCRVEE